MASDPTIALAEHMLDVDTLNATIDEQNMRAAHQEERAALEQQLNALHQAAHDMRVGAFVQGGLSLAGAAAGVASATTEPLGSYMGKGAQTLDQATTMSRAAELKAVAQGVSTLAGPAGKFFGDAPAADAQADAKAAEARVADARARADEAEHHHQRLEQSSERTLSTVSDISSSEAQGNLALIANV